MKIRNYPVGVFHQVRENITNRIDCTIAQTAVIFEAMEHAEEWAGEEQKRAEIAEARVRALEAELLAVETGFSLSRAAVRDLEGYVHHLKTTLTAVQWGSCDGCGAHRYCPTCGVGREMWSDEADDLVPGIHRAGCPVGVALGLTPPKP